MEVYKLIALLILWIIFLGGLLTVFSGLAVLVLYNEYVKIGAKKNI